MALILSLSSMAQTGLEFSQCLTFGGQTDIIVSNQPYSQEYTVPAGKIWKIEYAGGEAYSGTSPIYLIINNITACTINNGIIRNPIWVKPGDRIKISGPFSTWDYFISILEFQTN